MNSGEKMNSFAKKKINSHLKNWLVLLKSLEKKSKISPAPNYCNLYAYAANNPLRYIDPDGRKAGDFFDSVDEAAKDFALTYNNDSIKKNLEMASYIRTKDGKFYYDIPHEGDIDNVESFRYSSEKDIVALIHTHGAYVKKLDENFYISRALEPSQGYFEGVVKTKIPLYIQLLLMDLCF